VLHNKYFSAYKVEFAMMETSTTNELWSSKGIADTSHDRNVSYENHAGNLTTAVFVKIVNLLIYFYNIFFTKVFEISSCSSLIINTEFELQKDQNCKEPLLPNNLIYNERIQ
jgi:hypothetical protein